MQRCRTAVCVSVALLGIATSGCRSGATAGEVKDEALTAGVGAEKLIAADEDYFHDMDRDGKGPVALTNEEVRGRNTWIVWSGGNDRMWDLMSKDTFGALDFLKTLSSHPGLKYSRDTRWQYLGLVNEPCFDKAPGPDPARFGLWLDRRKPVSAECPADPFENEKKYPGIVEGARGKKDLPAGSYYGYATGVVGLRLFPNPEFDEAAQKKWDAAKYYSDPSYYLSRDLVKPYRVGMSCGFCHVGPNPVNPPADPENPKWENLSSNVGAQYFWTDRIFVWNADSSSFVFQLFHSYRPGALDTSLISSDNINNPRTMNAVYHLLPRLQHAKRFGKESLLGGAKYAAKQGNGNQDNKQLPDFYQAPDTAWAPRVLKDGSDSVGALGALNRVFLNIGLFSEEWLQHFKPLIGGAKITPIEIAVARKNSSYWNATEAQTLPMAKFFIKTTAPHQLADAPGGKEYLKAAAGQLDLGKKVFAERCARCHSSKMPESIPALEPGGCSGKGYLECWNKYWASTKTEEFKGQMRKIVAAPDFLENNYLSSELRVPVTLLQTNACSPLATNGIRGNIWDNFSSDSYQELPSVGEITWYHPYTGEPRSFQMPGGGRGYTRPPSLISAWSTAPYLLNNSVGKFEENPSVEARMRSFQDSIEQMLWPEKREKDALLGDKIPGKIDRTTASSYLRIPSGYLPTYLKPLASFGASVLPKLFGDEGVVIGPIPQGTPVGLLSNIDLNPMDLQPADRLEHDKKVLELLLKIKHDLKALPNNATDADARRVFANLVNPLLEVSKCPDLVVNRGHYFGTDKFPEEPALSDAEKRALIEFLKTM